MERIKQQQNESGIAEYFFKSKALHFCALLLILYTLFAVVLSIVMVIAEAMVISAVIRICGFIFICAGTTVCIFQCYRNRITSGAPLVMLFGGIILAANAVCDIIYAGFNLNVLFRALACIAFIVFSSAVYNSVQGKEFKTSFGFVFSILFIASAATAAIMLINSTGVFNACFAETYDWDFLAESMGTDDTGKISDYSYLFMNVNAASGHTKTIFDLRFVERIAYLVFSIFSSFIILRLMPYISDEKRRRSFFDDEEFDRPISLKKNRPREFSSGKVQRDRFGFPIEDRMEDDFADDFEDEIDTDAPLNDFDDDFDDDVPAQNRDYLDEKTGIFYYFDDISGRYYYIDKVTGESRFKTESNIRRPKDRNSPSGETMPWDLEDDEENIYRY